MYNVYKNIYDMYVFLFTFSIFYMCSCVYVCMIVCVCARVGKHTCTHIVICSYIYTHIVKYVFAICTHIHMHLYTYL